jgi:hypothetical protein
MRVDLKDKRFVILGLQGSGKTVLARDILSQHSNTFVYDTLDEYQDFNRYVPKHRSYTPEALREMDRAIQKYVVSRRDKVSLFIIDEANRYCPNRRLLPNIIGYLNDFNRHLHLSFGVIARRPAQLNTDLMELAHYLFIFRLVGRNDLDYLSGIVEGLDDAVRNLKPFYYVIVDQNRDFTIAKPVKMVKRH